MNIALCQINPIVGDFKHNLSKIISTYREAVEKGAELVVYPELAITGYPPQDLLFESSFIEQNLNLLQKLQDEVNEVPLITGYVRKDGDKIFNSAVVLHEGVQKANYDKILLPIYDVFDEMRYFTSGESTVPVSIQIGGKEIKVGLHICEDLWDRKYSTKVADELVENGAEILINISSSQFHEGKQFERIALIKKKVERLRVPFLYCNLVGAQDELIFDGHSLAYSKNGNLLGEGKQFEEEIIYVNPDSSENQKLSTSYSREEEMFKALVLGVKDYFRKTGYKKAVIGLSGGIDSSLTACIAKEALCEKNVTCLLMPSRFSSDHSISDSQKLCRNLGIQAIEIRIDSILEEYEVLFKSQFSDQSRDITEENIQARIRGNLLMAYSNKKNVLLLSTGNKTELALGYCTLYGDMSGGLAVISDLSKTDVYAVAKWVNESFGSEIIPQNVFDKPPSAELSEDQVDPFDYNIVSPLVDEIVENHKSKNDLIKMGYNKELVDQIYHLVHRSEFKRRQAAPGLRVSAKAFGMGRRYPIINHYKGN